MIPIRTAAGVLSAALLCACASPKPEGAAGAASTAAASGSVAGVSVAAAAALAGPANAPLPLPGRPGAIPLDAGQRAALDRAVAGLPPKLRPRLRYALASGDAGAPQVVVYDGEGLPPNGRRAGRAHDYTVFPVLNGSRGEHYDPEENTLIAPIPPPPQRGE